MISTDTASDAGGTLKLKTCSIFAEKNNYLGHGIGPGRLELSKVTATAARWLNGPTAQAKLRSISGICNVFHRFVPDYLRVSASLNKKL